MDGRLTAALKRVRMRWYRLSSMPLPIESAPRVCVELLRPIGASQRLAASRCADVGPAEGHFNPIFLQCNEAGKANSVDGRLDREPESRCPFFGWHNIVWDEREPANNQVASGTYLVRFGSAGFLRKPPPASACDAGCVIPDDTCATCTPSTCPEADASPTCDGPSESSSESDSSCSYTAIAAQRSPGLLATLLLLIFQ